MASCQCQCDTYAACQAYFFNKTAMTCATYDYTKISSFVQLSVTVSPATEILSFKTNITTCSNSLASVYFSSYSGTYKYTKTGNVWKIQKV
ncbi:unnamed protein product [Caenorhabditis angaria]|uniref:Uncharacterized protein n=1 Tax=Caenorhabditis angaria TaxID=860376 RepID=A0A9P1N093_9PELO|nr:unnamed protein product [Caenorhabditis angaria]